MYSIIKAFQKFTPRPSEELAPPRGLSREVVDRLDAVLDQTDRKLYGMPFELLQRIVHDPKLQEGFQADFGISFQEYLHRKTGGEMMGDTQVDGKWSSLK